ncbi:MAG: hypothetical protein EOS42_31400 [Mesorhizobium sp.]|nr:MAG: hypothetical protein EOS42_31400 [Mesorhizobium sp.]
MRADLPEGAQSREGDCGNQEDDGGEKGLVGRIRARCFEGSDPSRPLCPAGHLPHGWEIGCHRGFRQSPSSKNKRC